MLIFSMSTTRSTAQSTYTNVYNIFQAKCAVCHNSTQGILDLSGDTTAVYAAIVGKSPKNSVANAKGDKIIDPGYPHRSYLLRKINNGLDHDNGLGSGEGAAMPNSPNPPLSNIEIETVRQWILWGAPSTGNVVDTSLINTYYTEGGITPLITPPTPPAPGEGFQVHLGKFFVGKGEEKEWFIKYDPKLKGDIEINRVLFLTGTQSHHFVIYKYYPGQSTVYKNGLREVEQSSHGSADIVAPFLHYQTDTKLPDGTAYSWYKGDVLDFNFHVVNYNQDSVLTLDAYINIYTQPTGTAKDIMYAKFFPALDIVIPQDGNEHVFTKEGYDSTATAMWNIWTLYTHTHKYGLDYDIYLRDSDGKRGKQIYEGFCNDGICDNNTGGVDVGYYATGVESPQRVIEPLMELNPRHGIIHEAKFKNFAGPDPVYFGLTSNDEMMVAGFQFTIGAPIANTNTGYTRINSETSVSVYPNPFNSKTTIEIKRDNPLNENALFILSDLFGREVNVRSLTSNNMSRFVLEKGVLEAGVYIYKVTSESGNILGVGKIMIR